MNCFLYENHWGSPTLTLLNVHSVLGVLNVLNVLHTCASYMCFMCFMCFICPWTHRWPAGPCSNSSRSFCSFLMMVLNELDVSPYSRQTFFFIFPCLTSSKTSNFLARERPTRVDFGEIMLKL